jgi:CIC family chloride channel protein
LPPAKAGSGRLPPLERNQASAIRRMLEHRWFPLVLALVITGLGAASAALLFQTGLDALGRGRLRLLQLGPDWLLLPAIGGGGGLVAGLLVARLAPAAEGSGVPQVMQFLRGRALPMGFPVAVVKLLAGTVAIGSGFPLGPSGPSIQMGSSVGWEMARLLRAPSAFRRMIVAAGGGAGIAAVFRAPIGGFLYTLEELLQGARPLVMLLVLVTTFWADLWADLLGLANLSGLAGLTALTGLTLPGPAGSNPSGELQLERQVITYVEVVPFDLVVLFVLGAVVALAAEAYCRYVVQLHALRRRWRLPLPAAMAGAGVIIGLSDALLPADFINRAGIRQAVAEADVDIPKALAIALVLFLSTGLAAAAGTPGGLFAPMLTVGGALGLAGASLVEPLGVEAPSTAVFAGMGAFMAACARTPITATFIAFAITKNLLILKPILVASVGSYITARLLHRDSLFRRLMPSDPPVPATHPGGRELVTRSVPLRPRPGRT